MPRVDYDKAITAVDLLLDAGGRRDNIRAVESPPHGFDPEGPPTLVDTGLGVTVKVDRGQVTLYLASSLDPQAARSCAACSSGW